MTLTQKVYIGPNNRKLGLIRNTVIEDELPGYMKAAIHEVPEVAVLIVPVEELNAYRAKADRKGTREYRAYEVVAGVK